MHQKDSGVKRCQSLQSLAYCGNSWYIQNLIGIFFWKLVHLFTFARSIVATYVFAQACKHTNAFTAINIWI